MDKATWTDPKIIKRPVYKTVSDTRLARKMFPDFKDNNNGTLTIITGYKLEEPVILGIESGFTYPGPIK